MFGRLRRRIAAGKSTTENATGKRRRIDPNLSHSRAYFAKLLEDFTREQELIMRSLVPFSPGKTEAEALVVYIKDMVDAQVVSDFVIRPLLVSGWEVVTRPLAGLDLGQFVLDRVLEVGEATVHRDYQSAVQAVLGGETVLLLDTVDYCISVATPGWKEQPVQSSQIERSLGLSWPVF